MRAAIKQLSMKRKKRFRLFLLFLLRIFTYNQIFT